MTNMVRPLALDVAFLKSLKDKNAHKVIYCEKVWVHREDLAKFGDVRRCWRRSI
jgi:hypothetical protein